MGVDEAARSLAIGDGGTSEDAFGGLTGAGRSSTLCVREEALDTGGGISFEGGPVGGWGVVDTKREPRGYTAREPETRHDAPSATRAETCMGRG